MWSKLMSVLNKVRVLLWVGALTAVGALVTVQVLSLIHI